MSRRRRRNLRLPGGTVVRVERNLDSAQLGALIDAEEAWLVFLRHKEVQHHAQLSGAARLATDPFSEEGNDDGPRDARPGARDGGE